MACRTTPALTLNDHLFASVYLIVNDIRLKKQRLTKLGFPPAGSLLSPWLFCAVHWYTNLMSIAADRTL